MENALNLWYGLPPAVQIVAAVYTTVSYLVMLVAAVVLFLMLISPLDDEPEPKWLELRWCLLTGTIMLPIWALLSWLLFPLLVLVIVGIIIRGKLVAPRNEGAKAAGAT